MYKQNDSNNIPRSQETTQSSRTNKKLKTMRKTLPKNSTPNRFPFNPEKLNKHYRDLRRLRKHQIPPTNHQTQQTSKENRCTRLFRQTECIYASCRETTCVCMQLSGQKECICFKTRPGKGEKLNTQTESEQRLSSNDTTRNTIRTRAI